MSNTPRAKLQFLIENGNIEENRCAEIIREAELALIDQSNGGEMSEFVAAMVRCCGPDEDESAFFRCALDVLLLEKWGAKERDRAGLIGLLNMGYQNVWSTLRTDDDDLEQDGESDDEPCEDRPTFTYNIPAGMTSEEYRKQLEKEHLAKIYSQFEAATPPKSSGCLILLGLIITIPIVFVFRSILA